EKDAVLRHAVRRAGTPVFLLEDEPLHQRGAAAAVLLGPCNDGPARVEQRSFPLEVPKEALASVSGRQGLARDVRHEPRAGFASEGFLGGGEREIHGPWLPSPI